MWYFGFLSIVVITCKICKKYAKNIQNLRIKNQHAKYPLCWWWDPEARVWSDALSVWLSSSATVLWTQLEKILIVPQGHGKKIQDRCILPSVRERHPRPHRVRTGDKTIASPTPWPLGHDIPSWTDASTLKTTKDAAAIVKNLQVIGGLQTCQWIKCLKYLYKKKIEQLHTSEKMWQARRSPNSHRVEKATMMCWWWLFKQQVVCIWKWFWLMDSLAVQAVLAFEYIGLLDFSLTRGKWVSILIALKLLSCKSYHIMHMYCLPLPSFGFCSPSLGLSKRFLSVPSYGFMKWPPSVPSLEFRSCFHLCYHLQFLLSWWAGVTRTFQFSLWAGDTWPFNSFVLLKGQEGTRNRKVAAIPSSWSWVHSIQVFQVKWNILADLSCMKPRTKDHLCERGFLLNWASSCSTSGCGAIRDADFASASPATPSHWPDRVHFEILR